MSDVDTMPGVAGRGLRAACHAGVMIDEPLPEALSSEINAVLDEAGVHADRRLVMRMLRTAILLGEDGADRLDLKIASALWPRCATRSVCSPRSAESPR